MSIAKLADIRTKIRRLTGTGTSLQLTDSQIDDYINSFYLYDLPAQFRSLKLKDRYTFNTIRGIDTYAFDSEHYTTVEMPCYVAKREVKLFNDPWSFFGVWFNWQFQQNFAQGDGTAGPYGGTTQSTPIIRSVNNDTATNPNHVSRVQNILITANTATSTVNVTDDGNGTLYQLDSDGFNVGNVGTINYQTGVFTLTYINAVTIPSGNQIQIQYNPAPPLAIPLGILFFQNQFTVRPVPDRGYTVELIAYRQPTQALVSAVSNPNSNYPELGEWWELLAFGAAKKVYEDRVDYDGVALIDKSLAERYSIAETRTYAQLGKQSMATLFRDQLSYNYGSGGWGFNSGAN